MADPDILIRRGDTLPIAVVPLPASVLQAVDGGTTYALQWIDDQGSVQSRAATLNGSNAEYAWAGTDTDMPAGDYDALLVVKTGAGGVASVTLDRVLKLRIVPRLGES